MLEELLKTLQPSSSNLTGKNSVDFSKSKDASLKPLKTSKI